MATQGLPASRVVAITISLSPAAASYANLNTLLIVGTSSVIDTEQRIRAYSSLTEVGQDFAVTTPEYLAAEDYFDQSPQPTNLLIGRWAGSPTHARLVGGILSTADQEMTNWTSITEGSFAISIDDVPFNITGLNFSSETNLNGVASAIQTALQTAGAAPPATPTLTAVSGGTLAAGTVYVKTTLVTATGQTLPSTESSIVVTLDQAVQVSAPPSTLGPDIIGWNVYAADAAGSEVLQNTSPLVLGAAYTIDTLTTGTASPPTTNTATTPGSLAATCLWTSYDNFQFESGLAGSNSALSFLSTVSPLVGTDISAQLMGTSSTAQYVVDGIAAELATTAVNTLSENVTGTYGWEFAAGGNNVTFTDSDALAVAAIIEASGTSSGQPYMFGVNTSNTEALSSTSTTDIGAELQAANYTRTFAMYSSKNAYAAGAVFGLLLTTNFTGTNTMIDVMWKALAGITAEILTTSQANALDSKNYNYFAQFNNGAAIVVNGKMASDYYIDELYGMDAFANYIQTNVFNFMSSVATKVPQTDSGVNQIVRIINSTCEQFVTNGFLAPGTWTSAGFGPLSPGQTLSKGFLVYAPPISTQSATARSSRISPTIQVAAKEAGAINDVVVSVGINR